MIKKLYLLLTISFFAVLTIISCKKTDSTINVPSVKTIASVSGRITDLEGKPVSGALVTCINTTTTDLNGEFTIKDIELDKNAAVVSVSKTGYFNGSRTFIVNENSTNNIYIKLIPKKYPGVFYGSSGGNVSINEGGYVSFAANSIINDATKELYTGKVIVSSFFLNPTDEHIHDYMPGDLRGIDSSGDEKILQSFGMVAIELNDESGKKLQIAEGKTATINLPIPASLLSTAPATIPLWYFDETKGLWIEQGIATKQGTNYVGSVSHFSFWNCDIPSNFVELKITFKDADGNSLKNKSVKLTSTQYGSSWGRTDSTGNVKGLVPPNNVLKMELLNNCNTVIYSNDIGPFNTNADLSVITVSSAIEYSVNFSGTAVSCNNEAIGNGYVEIALDNKFYNAPVINGSFSTTIKRCSNDAISVSITAYDTVNQKKSEDKFLTASGAEINIGELKLCSELIPDYITLTINDTIVYSFQHLPYYQADSIYAYIDSTGSINTYAFRFSLGAEPDKLSFKFNKNKPNTISELTFSKYYDIYYSIFGMTGAVNTVTKIGAVGGDISGVATGTINQNPTMADPNYHVRNFRLEYKVKRRR